MMNMIRMVKRRVSQPILGRSDHLISLYTNMPRINAYTQATTANLNAGSQAVAVVAGGNVTMDMSASRVVVAGKSVDARSSALGVVIADNASVHDSNVVILITRNVDGNIKPQLDTRGAIIAGAVAGALLSTALVALSMLRPRKKK